MIRYSGFKATRMPNPAAEVVQVITNFEFSKIIQTCYRSFAKQISLKPLVIVVMAIKVKANRLIIILSSIAN